MKNRKIMLIMSLGILLLTGCAGPLSDVTYSGVTDEDPRVEFETFAKGYTYVEEGNFISQAGGYDEEVIINTEEDLLKLEETLKIDLDEDAIDFEEYMLYVQTDGTMGHAKKVPSYDIWEIAYNDNILVVSIDYTNKETVEAKEGEWLCFYNISLIKKEDFPYEKRSYLCIPN